MSANDGGATFHTLPVWKRGSTAAEWLEELAGLAREHPERWARVVVVFEEADAADIRWHQRNYASNTDVMGTLQWAALEVFKYMKGRRK